MISNSFQRICIRFYHPPRESKLFIIHSFISYRRRLLVERYICRQVGISKRNNIRLNHFHPRYLYQIGSLILRRNLFRSTEARLQILFEKKHVFFYTCAAVLTYHLILIGRFYQTIVINNENCDGSYIEIFNINAVLSKYARCTPLLFDN